MTYVARFYFGPLHNQIIPLPDKCPRYVFDVTHSIISPLLNDLERREILRRTGYVYELNGDNYYFAGAIDKDD